MIDAPPAAQADDPRKTALQNALQSAFAPIRQILPAIPRWDVREFISEAYENCMEYACSESLRSSLGLPEPAVDNLAMDAGLARIASAPAAFFALALERYRSLWTVYQVSHPDAAPVFNAVLKEHRLPFREDLHELDAAAHPSLIALFVRPGVLAAGAITFLFAVLGFLAALHNNLSSWLAGASLASLAVHASLLFTALVGLGIRRYTFGMWPLLMAALVLGAAWAFFIALEYRQALFQRRPLPEM